VIVRDAGAVKEGERVHVKLERGELQCDVTGHGDTKTRSKTN
jgi:exonuclease VII large subunit